MSRSFWRGRQGVGQGIAVAFPGIALALARKRTHSAEAGGLDENHPDRLPHELSGGQRQRLGLAKALSSSPDLVIADEAVSALDATTKLRVLDLFQTLESQTKLPMLFITCDFAVVWRIAQRVAVMRFGRLVEFGPTADVLATPQHAYKRALIAAGEGGWASLPPSRGHRIGIIGTQRDWTPMRKVAEGHLVMEDGPA